MTNQPINFSTNINDNIGYGKSVIAYGVHITELL